MTERRMRGRPRAFHDKSEQTTIQSLDRAMMILGKLSSSGGLTLTELSSDLEQSPTTVYRVLTTLAQREIVELDPASQTWHVGAGAFRIGSAFLRRTNLSERARPFLQRLMQSTGETANLAVRRGNAVLFVNQVETHASIRAFFPPGTISPMHASGVGKALLSALSDDEVRDILGDAPLETFTAKTCASLDQLLADLREARETGYAVDDEERNAGMRCVAAPILNADGMAVAGLSVSGPASRVRTEDLDRIGASVVAAARGLSAAVGYAPSGTDPAAKGADARDGNPQ